MATAALLQNPLLNLQLKTRFYNHRHPRQSPTRPSFPCLRVRAKSFETLSVVKCSFPDHNDSAHRMGSFVDMETKRNPFEILAKSIMNALKKTAAAALLVGLLLMHNTNPALAAGSGGRMGGRAFSSRSSSSSSSSSRSYSKPRTRSGSSSSSSSSRSHSKPRTRSGSSSSSWSFSLPSVSLPKPSPGSSSSSSSSRSYSAPGTGSGFALGFSSSVSHYSPSPVGGVLDPAGGAGSPASVPSVGAGSTASVPAVGAGSTASDPALGAGSTASDSTASDHAVDAGSNNAFLLMSAFVAFIWVCGSLSGGTPSDSVLTATVETSVIATEKTSVIKLQVGLLGSAKSLQKDLNRIAETADTSTPEGLHYVLTETILALLRHPDYCISAYSSVDIKKSMEGGENRFNQLSIEERAKFDEETLVNVNNIKKRNSTRPRGSGFSNEYIVITILVAAEGERKLPSINNSTGLKEALQKLACIPSSRILAVEVLWTPQNEDDTLSEQELLEDYSLLRHL